jgi:hypothetical protein
MGLLRDIILRRILAGRETAPGIACCTMVYDQPKAAQNTPPARPAPTSITKPIEAVTGTPQAKEITGFHQFGGGNPT